MRKNENYRPGDSISDSSEKLLQRGRRESQYICDLGERGVHAVKHALLQNKEQSSPRRILVLFQVGDIRIGLIKSAAENICLKTYPAKFFPESRVPHFCSPP